MKKEKGMIVSFYRDSNTCERCFYDGIERAVLIGDNIPEIFEPGEKLPAIYLCKGSVDNVVARPEKYDGPGSNWCAGNAFIWDCDSRFPFEFPVPVHDYDLRKEG